MTKDRLQEMKVISMSSREKDEDLEDGFTSNEESSLLSQATAQVEEFLERVSVCRQKMNELDENCLQRIRSLHDQLLTAPGADSSLTNQVNGLMAMFQDRTKIVHADIKKMQDEVNQLESTPNLTKTQTATIRIHRDQVSYLVTVLKNLIHQVQTEQSDYKERSKVKVINSLRVKGIVMEEEEIEDAIDNGDLSDKTTGLLLGHKERKALFEEVKSRHDELLILEKSLRELAEMFVDLQNLVESQGEMMNRIETNVGNAVEYAEKARTNVEEAKKLQASTRKKKIIICIFIMILLIILLLFLQGLVCHFTPIC